MSAQGICGAAAISSVVGQSLASSVSAIFIPFLQMLFGPVDESQSLLIDGIRPPLTFTALEEILNSRGTTEILMSERCGIVSARFDKVESCKAVLTYLKQSTLAQLAGLELNEPKRLNVSFCNSKQWHFFQVMINTRLKECGPEPQPYDVCATRTIMLSNSKSPNFLALTEKTVSRAFKKVGQVVVRYLTF
jgi:hypothetical protein